MQTSHHERHCQAPRPETRNKPRLGASPNEGGHGPGNQEATHQGARPRSHPGRSSPQGSTPDGGPETAPSKAGPYEEALGITMHYALKRGEEHKI